MDNKNQSTSTQVPVQVVDPDQLPKEKNWTYQEMCRIVGNLYLEAHKRSSLMEEQFNSILTDAKRVAGQFQQQLASAMTDNARLSAELERRNESRNNTVPNNNG
jgi:hypothetical protein